MFFISGGASAWNGEGTVLKRESIPESWNLELDYLASSNERQAFSSQLGVDIEVLCNYVFDTPIGKLQVNFVVTETREQAEALYELFQSIHENEEVGLNGKRVLEIVTQNPELIKLGRASLKFGSQLEEMEDLTVLSQYLEDNSFPIKSWSDITTILQLELDNYSIFLVGESHGVTVNQQLESVLLEFFVTEGGVRNYLLELSPSVVGYLQEYIKTGNKDLLNLVFESIRGTYFWTEENYEHWQNVRRLWQDQPEDQKFSLVGIDVEHQPVLAFRYLDYILATLDESILVQTKLSQIAAIFRGELSISNREIQGFVQDLLEDLETDLTQDLLGPHLGQFELVLSSLVAGLQLHSITDHVFDHVLWNDARDQVMYTNFLKQDDCSNDENKYFGQWGLNHVYQAKQMGVQWVASAINQEGKYRDRVLSIPLIYQDSRFLQNHSYEVLPLDNYLTSANLLGKLAVNQPLLVKLDGVESPFTENLIWKIRDPKPTTGVTTDYYQYILFIPGGEASFPLGK